MVSRLKGPHSYCRPWGGEALSIGDNKAGGLSPSIPGPGLGWAGLARPGEHTRRCSKAELHLGNSSTEAPGQGVPTTPYGSARSAAIKQSQ